VIVFCKALMRWASETTLPAKRDWGGGGGGAGTSDAAAAVVVLGLFILFKFRSSNKKTP